MRSTKTTVVLATGAVILLALATTGPLMSHVEEAPYAVEQSAGPIELRTYPPTIVAEAAAKGDRKTAIREGFQLIAGYIFGANVGSQKIEMTAPVMQQRSLDVPPRDQSIQQTAAATWKVRFVMPRSWSLGALPRPRDQRISLKLLPPGKFAAIRFSGLAGDTSIMEKTERLRAFIDAHNLKPIGAPILVFFNPPWTLPLLRRNEIMIEVQ